MRFLRWVSVLAFLTFAGCASQTDLPPISESGVHLPGKIVWRDLLTSDVETAGRFYEQLLGWDIEPWSHDYHVILHQGRLIGGIARKRDADKQAQWIAFMSVTDVNQAVEIVRSSGSRVILPPRDMPLRGSVAVIEDSEGAAFGVVHSDSGDPPDREADIGDWLWEEVWVTDPDAVLPFYEKIAGLRPANINIQGVDYRYLESDGTPRMGVVKKPDVKIGNSWVNYVRVADPEAVARRAESLGGKVLMAPREDIRQGSVAIIADPTGGALLVQRWPL
jgi:predicted enzyme related to lactoylglutathione lyase